MKEIELFYLPNCPYCKNARKAIDELLTENAGFRDIRILWIDESRETEKAESLDYWYVPSIFYDGKKLYEAQPGQDYDTIKAAVLDAFNTVVSD